MNENRLLTTTKRFTRRPCCIRFERGSGFPDCPFEFHISRAARDRYAFDEALFAFNGNVVFANFHAARVFAKKMNDDRDLVRFPERTVRAAQINAMGLIDEILHLVAHLYREEISADAVSRAGRWLEERFGRAAVESALERFTERFPPLAVARGRQSASEYLAGRTGDMANRDIALEEMLLLWLANANPAFSPYAELFNHAALASESAYADLVAGIRVFFDGEPRFGPYKQNLVDMLRSPAIAVPYSLPGQLEYIRNHWGALLGSHLARLLGSLDFLREEEKAAIFGAGGGGPGPSRVIDFTHLGHEPERYSLDLDWMPRLVLLAKNTHVWLDQLSKKYGRAITRLDQIPDEDLDRLARRGFTGLWLIGLWERSIASRRIKQLCGNPEALASAYSLYDYRIAEDLGGESAFLNLKERAWRRGLRMASDLVPNHMSIDSKWVVEHPDWFLTTHTNPFPSYTFNGPDVSRDERVGIFVEDHYYSRNDAAVVFKRLDRWTGDVRYIYHGNDGTSMPWSDTAQLNYLRADVREAVIRTILYAAQLFPILRFDAAMTLAKRHYQRLWFPEPGTGGAIPSRSDYGMTREAFHSAMPEEFWREVVDRAAAEAPDTLLLAEAFWLMEGYFVRTLGMHRVYNSAFMNMMRDEENAKYRTAIKNTLEFDPEILKRYVNFMNNPDERTAAEQFGKGDKYFGICILMSTLPGLPMFGHGQVEGFTEKYGMEYRKAYWDETEDSGLVERHEREIFPLLHRRSLFAGVDRFLFYDFVTPDGGVCEDVFAYSNQSGGDRALVLYHNRYGHTRGWIRNSAAFSIRAGMEGRKKTVRRSLAEGLELSNRSDRFCIFRDQTTGLEYLRSCQDLWQNGLYVELNAYQAHVFLDFREVADREGAPYRDLAGLLGGRGVQNVDREMHILFLRPVLDAFESLVNPEMMKRMLSVTRIRGKGLSDPALLPELDRKIRALLNEICRKTHAGGDVEAVRGEIVKRLEILLALRAGGNKLPVPGPAKTAAAKRLIKAHLDEDPRRFGVLLAWAIVRLLGKVRDDGRWPEHSRSWVDEWRFGDAIARALEDLGESAVDAWKSVAEVRFLTLHQDWHKMDGREKTESGSVLRALVVDPSIREFLQFNYFQGVQWFNKEAYEELTAWLLCIAAVEHAASATGPAAAKRIGKAYDVVRQLLDAMKKSGFRVNGLMQRTDTPVSGRRKKKTVRVRRIRNRK